MQKPTNQSFANHNNLIVRILTIVLLALLFDSCSEGNESTLSGSGFITPHISVDPDVIVADNLAEEIILPDVPLPEQLSLTLTDPSNGRQAHWQGIEDFDLNMLYRTGPYVMTAKYGSEYDEGFDSPFFFASEQLTVSDSQRNDVFLNAQLGNVVLGVQFDPVFKEFFRDFAIVFHSIGGNYVSYPMDETRNLFLRPGHISLMAQMTLSDGRSALVELATISNARARHFYRAHLSLTPQSATEASVVISFNEKDLSDDITLEINSELFDSPTPKITAVGFEPGTTLDIPEGTFPSEPVKMVVPNANMSKLVLTTQSADLISPMWPEETDLLTLTSAELDSLNALGLEITNNVETGTTTIDFTNLIPNLHEGNGQKVNFIVAPHSRNGLLGTPVELSVRPEPVDLTVVSASDLIVGLNLGEIIVSAPSANLERNIRLEALNPTDNKWSAIEIESIKKIEADGTFALRFTAPEGLDNLDLRIFYCDKLKAEFTLKRVSPQFAIAVDAFARSALVKIVADDPRLTPLITAMATPYDSHGNRLPVTMRNEETGMILVSGLEPESNNSIRLTVFTHPKATDFCPAATFRTERTQQPPNAGFEDVKKAIDYRDMLCGGRYSQNIVGIFNQQNKKTWKLNAPRQWANTNAKTFCTGARNHNTWYMQPSCYTITDSYGGAYAVELATVAWDVDGESIADYLQEGQPYVDYSRNIPNIAWRAAGKLFLGEYRFDPLTLEEVYYEGIDFSSRPTSLNGFYRFIPGEEMPSDKGFVVVEICGNVDGVERIIAHSTLELPFATDYTAFKVPLNYGSFGAKATKLRIMFASSTKIGTISYETTNITTTSNPRTAASIGGILSVDELSLSY